MSLMSVRTMSPVIDTSPSMIIVDDESTEREPERVRDVEWR